MAYLDPDLVADEVAVAESILAGIADRLPGWQPSEGHLESVISESAGVAIATAIQVLRDEIAQAYAGLGDILGVYRVSAAAAEVSSVWSFTESPGIVPGGTEVTLTAVSGDPVVFAVTQDTPVLDVVVETVVPLIAVEPGTFANGATEPAFTSAIVGATVTILGSASNGEDEEPLDDFRGRLKDRARRLRGLPITPDDHAAFALDVPGVARAFAVNRYDPTTGNTDAGGHVTVFVDGPAGALGPSVLQDLQDYFAAVEKVLNVTVHVGSASTVAITVAVTAQARTGEDPTALADEVSAAISTYFDRAQFDVDESQPGRWARPASTSVTVYQVHRALAGLFERLRVVSITINGGLSVSLPGPLSVPVLSGPPTVTIS